MPPMATHPNTIVQSSSSTTKSRSCDSSPSSMMKHVTLDENGRTNSSQIKLSKNLNKNIKSSHSQCIDCTKTISCESRKEITGIRRLNSGTYFKISDAKSQYGLRSRNSNSSLSKANISRNSRRIREKCHKLNSSCEKSIFAKEREEFVEHLVSRFEKILMTDQKNEVNKVSTNTNLTRPQLNSIGVLRSVAQDSFTNLCQEKPDGAQASQSHQFACSSDSSSESPTDCQKESHEMLSSLLPRTCKKQNCKCPADSNQSNVPLFKSTLLYNDCSDSASSRVVILASCINEYIRIVFQQLDHQNRGSISIEEFECLCRVLGISSSLSQTDKRASWVNADDRIELSGFEKLIWKCVTSENQKLPVSLEERRSSAILAHSVLNVSRSLHSLESITDDLRGISKSIATNEKLTRTASDEALPNCNTIQLLERNESNLDSLKEFSKSSIVCYEENKRMKSIIEDLRKALQASDAENLALRVKTEMLAEIQDSGAPNLRETGQEVGVISSESNFVSGKGKNRLSMDSSYGSGESNQSTPLWTRKRKFLDEIMSYYQPNTRKDEERSTSPFRSDTSLSDEIFPGIENHESVSPNSSSASEENYLCMDVIPGRTQVSNPAVEHFEEDSIYAPLRYSPMSFARIFKVSPKPSPRRSKTQGIGYSPNRARLYRSGLSRKSVRIYENFQPPTPPSIDSIPKRPNTTARISTTINNHFQKVSQQKDNGLLPVKECLNQNQQNIVRNNRTSMTVHDNVQLKKQTEIGCNAFKENLVAYTVTSFPDDCSVGHPNNSTSTSVPHLPGDDLFQLRPRFGSADELERRVNPTSSSDALDSRPIYQTAQGLQSSKSVTFETSSVETPSSSCPISRSAVKKFIRQKKGISVPELSSSPHLNSGWHTTLRHSASHLQSSMAPQPPASNGSNTTKLRSQPLPQLLATKAMLEATLNAVLLNNRLIADHGVRSLTPETLRRRHETSKEGVSLPHQDDDQSSNVTLSSTSSERENRSSLKYTSMDEFVGRDQLPGVKAEDSVKSDENKDVSSLCIENFAVESTKERTPMASKMLRSCLSIEDETIALAPIPEFTEKMLDTSVRANTLSKVEVNPGQTESNSIPSTVEALLAELADYCQENGVDISSRPSNSEPSTHFRVENSNELQLNSLDEADESRLHATQIKEATGLAVSKNRFDTAHESSVHIKSVPSEEIYISSCGSDDSGRGDSEGSCSSPEDLSGGSDDGLWTAEDDSPSSDAVRDCKCFSDQGSLACYFHRPKYCGDVVKVDHVNGHEDEKQLMNFEALRSSAPSRQPHYPCHSCGRVFCKCNITQKVSSVQCSSSFSYDQKGKHINDPKKIHEIADVTNGSNHDLKSGSLCKEVYDNINSASPLNSPSHYGPQVNGFYINKEPSVSDGTKLQIIDLDERPELVKTDQKNNEKLTSEKDFEKPKGFLGRRCRSFNTFRSFLSHTASQFKRNGNGRSSFSLPRTSSKAYDDFSIGVIEKELPKSIVKRPLSDYKDQKKKKRISFKDTVDVFPIKCQSMTSRIGENKPERFERYLCDASENFYLEGSSVDYLRTSTSPENDADVLLINDVKLNQTVLENNLLKSVKTLTPVNHNNVTLVSEINDSSDSICYLLPSTIPATSGSNKNLGREGTSDFEQLCFNSLVPSSDAKITKAECIPESRALLEALEDDLEVILKALNEDESKIL
ncbi:Coiled-coil domain-containing protein 48 [Trinorchestia longiramus]|nr:Coiled-coil domain-containing protein 48 [Trinorchestia longiramus]